MDLSERQAEGEQRHPWEMARATFFLSLLDRQGVLPGARRLLDAGAGDAWFAGRLRQVLPASTEVVGWDPNYSEADLVDHPDDGVLRTAERPSGRFDGILLLDVIEHVEEDRGFVAGLVTQSLAPDGWMLVAVPAYQSLFSDHDRALLHHRRYSPAQLRAVLESAGLELEQAGGAFHMLLPARAAAVVAERAGRHPAKKEGIGGWSGGRGATRALTGVLEAEGRMSLAWARRGWRVLPGLSIWAFCRPRQGGPG
ncbi:MAG TPA: methyltransferase domain-containing protein [Acidimicrobiales bacterium]|nr:methyltransferase domain-containing protein [Acidimicrobiales bacterium]